MTPYNQSVLTFCVGTFMLPLAGLFSKIFKTTAGLFSKIFKTTWTLKDNPLNSLGLWLNFAQLFYFPILFFTLFKTPGYFIMMYAIITGAHFFPYSWYYKTRLYALAAGIISIGSFFIGTYLPTNQIYLIPLLLSIFLAMLSVFLFLDFRNKKE